MGGLTNMKPATSWENYNAREDKYQHHHLELHHVPEDQEEPESTADRINTLWGSMLWKKVYGWYDTNSKTFIKSKRLN